MLKSDTLIKPFGFYLSSHNELSPQKLIDVCVCESQRRAMERHLPYGTTQCYLPQVNSPALIPANQAGTRFTYFGGMEGWVDLCG